MQFMWSSVFFIKSSGVTTSGASERECLSQLLGAYRQRLRTYNTSTCLGSYFLTHQPVKHLVGDTAATLWLNRCATFSAHGWCVRRGQRAMASPAHAKSEIGLAISQAKALAGWLCGSSHIHASQGWRNCSRPGKNAD